MLISPTMSLWKTTVLFTSRRNFPVSWSPFEKTITSRGELSFFLLPEGISPNECATNISMEQKKSSFRKSIEHNSLECVGCEWNSRDGKAEPILIVARSKVRTRESESHPLASAKGWALANLLVGRSDVYVRPMMNWNEFRLVGGRVAGGSFR